MTATDEARAAVAEMRARVLADITSRLAAMSDQDLAIVAAALTLGAPSALAAGGPSAAVEVKLEYGVPTLDPMPDAYAGVCAQALAFYRAVTKIRGLAPLL